MELLKAYIKNRQVFLFIIFILFIFVVLVSMGLFSHVNSIELTDTFHPLEIKLKEFFTERVFKRVLIGESFSLIVIVYFDYIKFKKKVISL